MSALIASLFAVGAAPTAAAPVDERGLAQVNASPGKTACLGPALDGADFSDVSMDSAHYDAVNCIAHYGITAGRGDGTFGADDSVTRSQMALFLSEMATLAGVTLDDAMDAGFTDLGDTGDNRVSAINRLVNGGIMTGTSGDTFSPTASVTRAEMALWLANFMVVSTGNDTALNVVKDAAGTYTITRPDPSSTDAAARTDNLNVDYFPDARLTQPQHVDSAISAVFELGIAAGYGDNEFKGHRLVSRQEMATFITRTLAHTNVRPSGLTAQLNLGAGGGIQVSLRTADFAPVANEAIDVFRSFFPDYARNADGTCQQRYVDAVTPGPDACEIDAGDAVTDAHGNKDYTAEALQDPGEGSTIMCGTTPFSIAAATAADAVYWVWTGGLDDTVGADTQLVRVEGVAATSRMGLEAPDHASVSGGLDSSMDQREAKMGSTVMFTLQLHGEDNADGTHPPAAPDSSGNKYELVIQVNELGADGSTDANTVAFADEDRLPGAASPNNSRSAVSVTAHSAFDSTATDTYDRGLLISRTPPRVVSPDSSGMISIPVTYADPDRSRPSPDVVVTVELTAYQPAGTPTPADYNTITDFHDDALNIEATVAQIDDPNNPGTLIDRTGFTAGFETRVIFSDDSPRPQNYVISADAPSYRLYRGVGRPVGSTVDISARDQYGDPVRGLSVSAISNQTDATTGKSTMPFVVYFTTRSDGTYRVTYHYSGGSDDEKLIAFASVPYDHDNDTGTANRLAPRDATPGNRDLEDPPFTGGTFTDTDVAWDHFLPANAEVNADGASAAQAGNQATVHWSGIGELRRSQGGSGGIIGSYANSATADTGLLAVDVGEKAFVVKQETATADDTADPPVEAAVAGNYVYYWDEHDTFEVNSMAVSMELFETIVSTSGVTVATLSWSSYDYNRPNDRAHWTVTCS